MTACSPSVCRLRSAEYRLDGDGRRAHSNRFRAASLVRWHVVRLAEPSLVAASVWCCGWHPVLPGPGYGAVVPDVLAIEDGRRWRYISPVGGEPAIVVERRKELTYLLCQAAELEHALMCQYLYAAFSLKSTADSGLRADQLEAVERWRRVIFAIAGEEMLH